MPRVRISTQPAPPGTGGSEPNALLDTRVRRVGADLVATVTLSRGLMQCVSLATRILTERGWLSHNEVEVGDRTLGYNPRTGRTEWTTVTKVVHYDDAPVLRIGHRGWHADVTPKHRWWSDTAITVAPMFTSCPECGWLSRGTKKPSRGVQVHRRKVHGLTNPAQPAFRGEFVRTDDFKYGHRLRLAAPADTSGIPGLSVEDVAVLAWLEGDGHIAVAREKPSGEYDGSIYQSKPAMVSKLRALLARTEHTETVRAPRTERQMPQHVFRLRRSYVSDLIKRSGLMESGPEMFVLSLSPDQRAAWLSAMIDAEGHRQAGKKPTWSEYVRIAQVNGPLQDAIKLAVYLEGWRPTFSANSAERNGYQPAGVVGMAKPHVAPSMFREPQPLPVQTVWCVKTELETWTAGLDGQVFLTGNTIGSTFNARKPGTVAYRRGDGMPGVTAVAVDGRFVDPARVTVIDEQDSGAVSVGTLSEVDK